MSKYILPKRHKPGDIITIMFGPHKGESMTHQEYQDRFIAPIRRNICRCMGAMHEGRSAKSVVWEEV